MVASLTWSLQTGALMPPAVDPGLWDPRLLWGTLLLAAVTLVGVAVIAVLKRWREYQSPEEPSADEQLAHFRALYDQGELSADEFARIKARLSEQMRQQMDLPAGGAEPRPPREEEPPPSSPDAQPNPPP